MVQRESESILEKKEEIIATNLGFRETSGNVTKVNTQEIGFPILHHILPSFCANSTAPYSCDEAFSGVLVGGLIY